MSGKPVSTWLLGAADASREAGDRWLLDGFTENVGPNWVDLLVLTGAQFQDYGIADSLRSFWGGQLSVRNSGSGCESETATKGSGLGLIRMHEGIKLVNGELSTDSQTNRGRTDTC